MFKIMQHQGFHMTFANGHTVSVQFGPGHYCEHHDAGFGAAEKVDSWSSKDAECAAWDADGEWVRFEGMDDDVRPYCSADEVLEFMERVRALKGLR